MGMTTWNPVREMLAVNEAMNRYFGNDVRQSASREANHREAIATLPIDAYTTGDEIVVLATLPGVSPDEVNISIEGDTLTIEGEIPALLENVDYQFAERFHGKFRRTLRLNVPVDLNGIEATSENGVLTLTLPKAEEVKPKQIKVSTH
jgi:HSP20 family protein